MHLEDRRRFESLAEADLQDRVIDFFSQWFDVSFEITSLCRTRRIDVLMYHNSDIGKYYPIGIELKKTDVKRGGDIAKWCAQASDYTKILFHNKKVNVFILPQISGWYLDEGERVSKHNIELPGYMGCHNNINSFLYQSFGFGELQKYYYKNIQYCRLVVNTYCIWDSQRPTEINFNKLTPCQ